MLRILSSIREEPSTRSLVQSMMFQIDSEDGFIHQSLTNCIFEWGRGLVDCEVSESEAEDSVDFLVGEERSEVRRLTEYLRFYAQGSVGELQNKFHVMQYTFLSR